MDPNDKKLLREVYELSRENHLMLKKLRAAHRAGTIFRALYWIIIIGGTLGAYYYIEPYLEKASAVYSQSSKLLDSFGSANNIPSQENLKNFFGGGTATTTPAK